MLNLNLKGTGFFIIIILNAKSSTGKTMAYAIPVIQDLQSQQPKIQRHDGPVALVIVPTREVRQRKLPGLIGSVIDSLQIHY